MDFFLLACYKSSFLYFSTLSLFGYAFSTFICLNKTIHFSPQVLFSTSHHSQDISLSLYILMEDTLLIEDILLSWSYYLSLAINMEAMWHVFLQLLNPSLINLLASELIFLQHPLVFRDVSFWICALNISLFIPVSQASFSLPASSLQPRNTFRSSTSLTILNSKISLFFTFNYCVHLIPKSCWVFLNTLASSVASDFHHISQLLFLLSFNHDLSLSSNS